ncbi:hypothetical protein QAD02_007088 [Eretmocerus hayati]|uniref:Uncharacterized protein n=1 Tax=Eretmocerus hayati TaxID=131215 RepID=A0ACC2N3Z8_9HYME|nr:hypothetical protein QAD02_007088 [Eretmocerus hayati]
MLYIRESPPWAQPFFLASLLSEALLKHALNRILVSRPSAPGLAHHLACSRSTAASSKGLYVAIELRFQAKKCPMQRIYDLFFYAFIPTKLQTAGKASISESLCYEDELCVLPRQSLFRLGPYRHFRDIIRVSPLFLLLFPVLFRLSEASSLNNGISNETVAKNAQAISLADEENIFVSDSLFTNNVQVPNQGNVLDISDNVPSVENLIDDPSIWPTDESFKDLIVKVGFIQNLDADFSCTKRPIRDKVRDPSLKSHIEKYDNKGLGSVSYLSSFTCNEFIGLMAKKVLHGIVGEIRESGAYSINKDSTPDISHVDQLTFIMRYVDPLGIPRKRFL